MTKEEYMDVYKTVGAGMEVYNTLGYGMAEPIYQEALAVEMAKRGMAAEREKPLRLYYKDVLLEKRYFADLYYKGISIELKSVSEIVSEHRAQLFNYMRNSHTNRGIIINYGEESLYVERYLYLPDIDEFVMLNHDNYKDYITE